MPTPSGRPRPQRPSGSERVFEDERRRLWSAGRSVTPDGNDAIIFTCLSDTAESQRAASLDEQLPLSDIASEELRELLRVAPRLGRL